MPRAPNSIGGRIRQRSYLAQGVEGDLETPLKKRLRRIPAANGVETHPGTHAVGALGAHRRPTVHLDVSSLVEIFALLSVRDIGRSAAVTTSWQEITEDKELWALANPRLGLHPRIVNHEELCRRRSRGTVLKGLLLGCDTPKRRIPVLLRTVHLSEANAGTDDGLLPSVIREVALLRSLATMGATQHVTKLLGAEIQGELVHIATEYMPSSFATWFANSRAPAKLLRDQIQSRFEQLFRGLGVLHAMGIIHRNLIPSNVLFDDVTGVVKICDLARARAVDQPLRPYSPEDPKLRTQSTREAKRLWYRAPELLLRQELYGAAVDIWSAGCLLAEAANGYPLFPSECEMDHLFRIFRFCGTPSHDYWPQGLGTPEFSAKFPVYTPVTFDESGLFSTKGRLAWHTALDNRPEARDAALRMSIVLGAPGMELLGMLLKLDPNVRVGANSQEVRNSGLFARSTASLDKKDVCADTDGTCIPPLEDSNPPLWNAMARLDTELRTAQDVIGSRISCEHRAEVIDYMAMIARRLDLSWSNLHLAVVFMDEIIMPQSQSDGSYDLSQPTVALSSVACLKLAEAFDELSHEYFQRERTATYASVTKWSEKDIIEAEKCVAQKIEFNFHRPTAIWFLRSLIGLGHRNDLHSGGAIEMARFILDLSLLDMEGLAFPAPLRAQSSLLLAIYITTMHQADNPVAIEGCGATPSQARQLLELWEPIRVATCATNQPCIARKCIASMIDVLLRRRRHWASCGLREIDLRNPRAVTKFQSRNSLQITSDTRNQRGFLTQTSQLSQSQENFLVDMLLLGK